MESEIVAATWIMAVATAGMLLVAGTSLWLQRTLVKSQIDPNLLILTPELRLSFIPGRDEHVATETIYICNTGQSPITVRAIVASSDKHVALYDPDDKTPNDFHQITLPLVLGPNASRRIQIAFKLGALTDRITVVYATASRKRKLAKSDPLPRP